MRILHTLAEPALGGLEFRTLDQASWLHRHGYGVAVAAPRHSAVNREARLRDLTVVDIEFSPAYAPSTILSLRRAIKTLRIDIVDCHSRADAKTAALCRDLCSIVRTRHFAKPMRSSLRRRLEWKYGCDHVIATSLTGQQELVTARLASAERISVVGEWAADSFFDASPALDAPDARDAGLPARLPAHLHSNVPTRLQTRRELGLHDAENTFLVATIGMLRPEKRQADLLRVVHRLRTRGVPAAALVVGMPTPNTMDYAYQLHQLAIELGLSEHVVFAGHRNDVATMMNAADVVLVPSSAEAWSRVVPEAFAVGRPVVASNVGGLSEIITPGQTGWLAPPGDVAGYADCIMQIREQPAHARAVVQQARRYAQTHFRLSEKMFSTLNAYARALHNPVQTCKP